MRSKKIGCLIFVTVSAAASLLASAGVLSGGAGWSALKIRDLPDASFAAVEQDDMGRKIRHCPHHDQNGRIDWDQLIYVLGSFHRETWVNPRNAEAARRHLEKHYHWFRSHVMDENLSRAVEINRSPLSRLVALPTIGPVLAVKIVEYRSTYGRFQKIEDIRNVDGIGGDVLSAIRHYAEVD